MKKILLAILKRSSRRYIARHDPFIIGITGSVGKTSCRMVIAQTFRALLPDLRVTTSPHNFNSEIGLCLSILEQESWSMNYLIMFFTIIKLFLIGQFGSKKYDVLVAEYGIDSPGDMSYLLSIAKPNIAIFTVLDKVHAHQLGSPDEILEEKMKLLQSAKEINFVSSGAKGYTLPHLDSVECDLLYYSLSENGSEDADIWRRNWTLSLSDHGLAQASFTLEQGNESVSSISTNLLSKIDAGYISLGIELSMILSQRLGKKLIDVSTIGTLNYEIQAGRMSLFKGKWGSVILDSSYSAGPQSMNALINHAIMLRNTLYGELDLMYCLGDMRELGDFTEQEHRGLASVVAQSADGVYLVGENMNYFMIDELKKIGHNMHDVKRFDSSDELGECLAKDLPAREKRALILFKGSQNTIFMEEGIKRILKDSADCKKLCRQSRSRLKKKKGQ